MSMAAIGISLGTMALSYGISAATQPSAPNLASSSRELSNAEAALLPIQRGMEAAAASGKDFTFTLPAGINGADYGFTPAAGDSVQQVWIPNAPPKAGAAPGKNSPDKGFGGQWVAYDPADFEPGGKYADLSNPLTRTVTAGNNGKYTVSFKGYGTADTMGQIAKQNAANSLALSQKYDAQFIQSALDQEKLADPEGWAARQRMDELIHEQMNRPTNQPVADLLNQQVDEQLKAGRGLDDFDKSTLDRAVADALASRGGGGGQNTDFAAPLTTGAAGEARRAAGIQKALGFATSGATPEDVNYRRDQQNMANLSAEVNGQTPQSQFASLSGAQKGPTPTMPGAPLPTMPGNAGTVGANAALTQYGAQLAQPNSWMMGLTTLLNGLNAAGNAGWKPVGG